MSLVGMLAIFRDLYRWWEKCTEKEELHVIQYMFATCELKMSGLSQYGMTRVLLLIYLSIYFYLLTNVTRTRIVLFSTKIYNFLLYFVVTITLLLLYFLFCYYI